MRDTAAAASLGAWLPGRNRRRLAVVLLATLAIAVLPVAFGRGRLPRRSWTTVASSTGARGLTDARALDPRSPRVFSDASSEPVAVAPGDDDDDFPQIQRETDPRVIRVPFPGYRPAGEANLIVIITPTYIRPTSKSPPQPNVLLRMYNALCGARGHQFLWILAQSRADASRADAARRLPEYDPDRHLSRVHVHTLAVDHKPTDWSKRPSKRGHRGIEQRNAALALVRDRGRLAAVAREAGFEGIDPETVDPIVYFGDDDNEYDPLLFDEMSKVRDIGVWPVGFPSAMRPHHVETVSVGHDGKVRGYFSAFCDRRVYNLDMAAFAVRASVLGAAEFSHESRVGHIEDDLLREALGDDAIRRLEPLADGATRVYVWHLGWKFDRDKGKWGFLHTVEQPAKMLCEPLEIQEFKHKEKMKKKKAREEEKKKARKDKEKARKDEKETEFQADEFTKDAMVSKSADAPERAREVGTEAEAEAPEGAEKEKARANATRAAEATAAANAPSPSESEAFGTAEDIAEETAAEEAGADAAAPSPSEAEEAEAPAPAPAPAESKPEGRVVGTIETRAKPSALADDDGGHPSRRFRAIRR